MELIFLTLSVLCFLVAFVLSGKLQKYGYIKFALISIIFVMGVALFALALKSWSVFYVSIASTAMMIAFRRYFSTKVAQK